MTGLVLHGFALILTGSARFPRARVCRCFRTFWREYFDQLQKKKKSLTRL